MSDDEVMVLVLSGCLGAVLWGRWLYRIITPAQLVCPSGARLPLLAIPAACLVLLIAILATASASDVRDSAQYMALYTLLGAAWVGAGTLLLPFIGLSERDDVIERRNPAAAWACGGALAGLTLCFAGGNIGDGPGWWVVFFSAGLATAAFFALWWLTEVFTGITEIVTIDRDVAAGVRLGAMLTAFGLILGRAAAGNWVSAQATVADFAVVAWPALGLVALESIIAIIARPTHEQPTRPVALMGAIPATAHLAAAAIYIVSLGHW